MNAPAYNFAYLDEQTKRMIRRAILKAIAIPGYQVPFASREMPMPYGWGTGGVQVTAAIIGPDDVLKVIDQGADDTTNAVSIRTFFAKTAGVATTTDTTEATVIQTRHRIPETPLTERPDPRLPGADPRAAALPRAARDRDAHACTRSPNTALMHVKLYEDIARHGHIATTYAYPAKVAGRYVMDPSPIAEIRQSEDRRLPGAAIVRRRPREAHLRHPAAHRASSRSISRIIRSSAPSSTRACAFCGATDSFLDEVVTDDQGGRMFVCSDTDYCEKRRGHEAEIAAPHTEDAQPE